ncbi:MAG TPA: hypothetical protein VK737_01435 [Opitutales bacterium]|jgi:hypothetical protein|nr:hypothetical protein [Opitutales bacterium]
MSAELPENTPIAAAVAEPSLRPTLNAAGDLPEPWIRLAMARARTGQLVAGRSGAERPALPHSKLGVAAFVLALAAAVGFVYQYFGTARIVDTFPDAHFDHGTLVGSGVLNSDATAADFNNIFPYLAHVQSLMQGIELVAAVALALGVVSLFMRDRRRHFGGAAIAVIVLLTIIGLAFYWLNVPMVVTSLKLS